MHFELNLDEKVISKIKKILESGEYENEKEVIIRAIDNLHERTISEFEVSPDSVVEFIHHKMSKPLERNLTVDASEKYGEEGRLTKRAEKYFEMGETYFDAGKHEQSLEFLEIASQAISDLFERYPHVKNTHWTSLLEKIRVLQSDMQVEEEDSFFWMRIKDWKNDIKSIGALHDEELIECFVPDTVSIYGKKQVGLIWGFHNRFFPVKFIISVLASLILRGKDEEKIIGTKHPWINLETFSDEVALEAVNLITILNDMKEQNKFHGIEPTVGFLATRDKFLLTPRLKKTARRSKKLAGEKAVILEETSRNRFLTQYVGRELSPRKGTRTIAGACFEMGLVKCGYDPNSDNKLYVTLTDLGKEFAVMDNLLVGAIQDHLINVELSLTTGDRSDLSIKNIFSKEESDFILKNIISKYELEEKVVNKFLESKERLSVDEITKIFLEIQKKYIKEFYGADMEKHNFVISNKFADKLGMMDMSDTERQKEIKEIMKDMLETDLPKEATGRATTIIKRMHELGLVQREQEGLKVFYAVISS